MPAFRRVLAATCLCLLPVTLAAQQIQSLSSIRETARVFAESTIAAGHDRADVEIGRLDPRLRLQKCETPLEAFRSPGQQNGGRTTIGVRCASPRPWTIYVSARVNSYAQVYTTARSLGRGERIREGDLRLLEANVGNLSQGYYTELDQLLGMEVRRPSRPGEVLTPSMVAAPRLVTRGQTVTVLADAGAARVTMQGTAMEDGGLGDRIRVKNPRSERVIEGEITGEGRVRVTM
ncbi:MAG: flagellar basal body P-ring formation protein FlgA [Ectothiorhodospiraceae bacterium]|nr:flagellar basal body P-ring formation protein FlgA [Ectothiorhodospiraceae bacterium]